MNAKKKEDAERLESALTIGFKDPEPPFAKRVWNVLSRIDVGDHIEVKGDKVKLSYLSWSWAWAQLMNHFPESFFLVDDPDATFPDGSVMVSVTVTVKDLANEITRRMWLPVMDNRNNAIPNPSARHVSDSTMRCLVKCLALFGLGLDLYAKSDMPVGSWEDAISADQAELLTGLLESSKSDVAKFLKWLDADSIETIKASKYKQARLQLERKIKQAKKQ